MVIRNLTTRTDEEFLQESTDAVIAAIEAGNAPLAYHWARHAASFALGCERNNEN